MLCWPLDADGPKALEHVSQGKIDLVINIPKNADEAELTNDYLIRRRDVDFGIPLITNIQLAHRFVESIARKSLDKLETKSWSEYVRAERSHLNQPAPNSTTCVRPGGRQLVRHHPIIDLVVGARPNFMKLAPVVRGLQAQGLLAFRIVHTGQHYDESMSGVFLDQLGLPTPDVHLDAGSGTHGAQTARILERYEALLLEDRPSATVVFGDVNGTIACALAAAKLGVPVAHVEAGLRSFDRTMPEELNRVLTDAIADLLLVSEASGIENLRREGIAQNKVRMVGNVMIDTLLAHLPAAETRRAAARLGLNPRGYGFVTLHRPSNVDDPATLRELVLLLHELSHDLPLVFAVHPRTMQAVKDAAIPIESGWSRLFVLGPQAYLDSISFLADAAVVLTDSGGLQEEASVLGIPCITLRDNTERPITVTLGTSRLVGRCPERIRTAWNAALGGDWPVGQPIPLWDGNAGQRVAQALSEWLGAMPDSADTPELDGTFRHLEQQPAR